MCILSYGNEEKPLIYNMLVWMKTHWMYRIQPIVGNVWGCTKIVHADKFRAKAFEHNWNRSLSDSYSFLTFPKLPFPMARSIWKWSKFTAKRKAEDFIHTSLLNAKRYLFHQRKLCQEMDWGQTSFSIYSMHLFLSSLIIKEPRKKE